MLKGEEHLTAHLENQLDKFRARMEANENELKLLTGDDSRIKRDLTEIEQTMQQMKIEVDHLTKEIKDANLQSLSIAPTDDLKVLLEGNSIYSSSLSIIWVRTLSIHFL